MFLKLFIAFGICAVYLEPSWAQRKAPIKRRKKIEYVRVTVVTDGAAVYAKPDFDSTVLGFLPYEAQAVASTKALSGRGGMGLFHRVRYKSMQGYIPDTDIRIAEKVMIPAKEKSPSKAFEKIEPEKENDSVAPIYLTRYLGGAFSMVNFTERYSGKNLSANMPMYGLRMTGPGTLFDGPPLDFNLWFSMSKPSYFSRFSSGEATGFLLFGDVMAMLPLLDTSKFILNYGLGLMWTYTRYKIPVKELTIDSQELRVGIDLAFGGGYRIGKKNLIRADVKYYIEKTSYLGYMASWQVVY